MPPGEMLANRMIIVKAKPGQQNYQAKNRIMETFKVLGRTLTAFVPHGTTMEKAFIKAVEDAGGKVFRKYYPKLKKYEIVAVVFRDAALVKNDPQWIAEQDFSFFEKDEKKIKEMTMKKAKEAEGGLHFFEGEKGIPVLVDKYGGLTFLSPDEMLARKNRKKKPIEVREVPTNIDPKTIEESREGARAIREKDQAVLDRLAKAGADHASGREKSIEPLSTYALIDADTGDVKSGELNSGLGSDILVSKERFVPEIILIRHFARDSQVVSVNDGFDKPDWEQKFRIPETVSGREIQLPSVYNVCVFDVPEDSALAESNTGETQQFDANAECVPIESTKNNGDFVNETPKALPPVPSQAASFDGFAPPLFKSIKPSLINPKTRSQTAVREKTKDFKGVTLKRKVMPPFKGLCMRPIVSSFKETLKMVPGKDHSERAGRTGVLKIKKVARSAKTSKITRKKRRLEIGLNKKKKRKTKKYSLKSLKKNAGRKKRTRKKKNVRKKLMPIGNLLRKSRRRKQGKQKKRTIKKMIKPKQNASGMKNKTKKRKARNIKIKTRNARFKVRKPKRKTQDRKSGSRARKRRKDPKQDSRKKKNSQTQKSRSKTPDTKRSALSTKRKTRKQKTRNRKPKTRPIERRNVQWSIEAKEASIGNWKLEMLGLTGRGGAGSSRQRLSM